MTKIQAELKTIISYYGGKQQLLPKILPLIPEHKIYTESFFGGGSVFFAKNPVKIEAINDVNKMVVNFYKVAKRNFKQLKIEIDDTLYSEEQFMQARSIYLNSDESQQDTVLKAWSLFVLSHQTFLHILDNTWNYSRTRDVALTFTNKKQMFDERYIKRLEHTQIFCRDALKVLKNMDDKEAFHFIDPPYIDTDQGHYSGYDIDQFRALLQRAEQLEGKFLLTTFPSQILTEFAQKNGWYQIEFEMAKAASMKEGARKVEVFTMNYQPTEEMLKAIKKDLE